MTSLLNLFRKKCIALTDHGKGPKCTRNAEKDSNYCWQHKPDTINLLLESGIAEPQVVEILQYAGEYITKDFEIQRLINKDLNNVIKWYGTNNFKPLFHELPESQI
jgi:hypothetical protein